MNAQQDVFGVVRVPIRHLFFPGQNSRQVDDRVTEHLHDVFQKTTCNPDAKDNWIRGIVTGLELRIILRHLNLTLEELRSTLAGGREPPLLQGFKIRCKEGRHRVAAALLGKEDEDVHWVVELNRYIENEPTRRSHYLHQAKPSDTDIFYGIRWCMRCGDKKGEDDWRSCLTPPKMRSLDQILKRPGIVRCLDKLEDFPGVSTGMRLGNWHKYLARRLDRLIEYCLMRIYDAWDQITGGNELVRPLVTLNTVQYLRLRAPRVSGEDRRQIRALMRDRTLFPDVELRADRDCLERNIIAFPGIIPSLETMEENLKYISYGALILERYLPKLPDGYSKQFEELRQKWEYSAQEQADRRGLPPTLDEQYRRIWTPPLTAEIETNHNVLVEIREAPHPRRAFVQMLLAALRHCRYLGTIPPRQDIRGEKTTAFIDATTEQYLTQLGIALGYQLENKKFALDNGLRRNWEEKLERADRLVSWRCGYPFKRSLHRLTQTGFLTSLVCVWDTKNPVPPPEYVLHDLIKLFLGEITQFPLTQKSRHLQGIHFQSTMKETEPIAEDAEMDDLDSSVEDQEMADVLTSGKAATTGRRLPRTPRAGQDRRGRRINQKQKHRLVQFVSGEISQPQQPAVGLSGVDSLSTGHNREQVPVQPFLGPHENLPKRDARSLIANTFEQFLSPAYLETMSKLPGRDTRSIIGNSPGMDPSHPEVAPQSAQDEFTYPGQSRIQVDVPQIIGTELSQVDLSHIGPIGDAVTEIHRRPRPVTAGPSDNPPPQTGLSLDQGQRRFNPNVSLPQLQLAGLENSRDRTGPENSLERTEPDNSRKRKRPSEFRVQIRPRKIAPYKKLRIEDDFGNVASIEGSGDDDSEDNDPYQRGSPARSPPPEFEEDEEEEL